MEIQIFNKQEFLERLGDDNDIAIEVIKIFLEDIPIQTQRLGLAIMKNDIQKIHIAAHTIKGVLKNLSANNSAQTAANIEEQARANNTSQLEQQFLQLKKQLTQLTTILQNPTLFTN